MLIDNAIRHFGEWCFIGTRSTAHWGFLMYDVTNQYVLEAVQGGVLTLLLFVAMLALGYRGVGQLWRATSYDKQRLAFTWAIGVALFVHIVNFIGISYSGQNNITFFPLLAGIASLQAATVVHPIVAPMPQRAATRQRVVTSLAGEVKPLRELGHG